jgi:hypothetical protein
MRRQDREITSREQIDNIIRQSQVCRLALSVEDSPYLVPLSFGYDGEAIFVHTASVGKKIEYFQANPRVCFEFEHGVQLRRDDQAACNWSFLFETVIGHGAIQELSEPADKEYALRQIMRQYSEQEWVFGLVQLSHVRVWKISIDSLTGKRSQKAVT